MLCCDFNVAQQPTPKCDLGLSQKLIHLMKIIYDLIGKDHAVVVLISIKNPCGLCGFKQQKGLSQYSQQQYS